MKNTENHSASTKDRTMPKSKSKQHDLCLCPKALINIYANGDNEIIIIEMKALLPLSCFFKIVSICEI